jgi:hypothetical protein
MGGMKERTELEETLNSFDPCARRTVLESLAGQHVPSAEGTNLNMHLHSFFSYNAEGHSPSRIAWEAKKTGLYAAGLCDFDVLDGLEEFLQAGLLLKLRATVNVETRAYLKEYGDVDINSPGENGVTYIMGAGFARMPEEDSPQAEGLAQYRNRARTRNTALVKRINSHVSNIAIDYEQDVLPLTPAGCATERHIVSAYIRKAMTVLGDPQTVATFWSDLLGKPFEETAMLLSDVPALEELVRSKLVKRGGVGYEPPSPDTFPPVDDFVRWVNSCGAVPMATWLDGTSEGEKDGRAMLECMRSKGAAALNIIPDRNWNISDPAQRAEKTANLKAIVETADAMGFPINIGTEMNKLGLPFVDQLDGEELSPFKESFLRGARIMVGHTVLLRYAGFSYVDSSVDSEFPDIHAKNEFFEAVGGFAPPDMARAQELEDMGQEKAFAAIRDTVGTDKRNMKE